MQLSKKSPSLVLLSRVNRYVDIKITKVMETAHRYPVYSATTAHAYVINLVAATRLLKLLYPVWGVANKGCLFEEYVAIKLLAVQPAPVMLHDLAQQTPSQHLTILLSITSKNAISGRC